jgi:hypothetical protein
LFLIPSFWDSPLERRKGEKIFRGKTKRESQKRKKKRREWGKKKFEYGRKKERQGRK